MLAATMLGDSVADLVGSLRKVPIVGDEIATYAQRAFTLVRSEATSGARSAIPEIKSQVHDAVNDQVKPWVIGSLALGGVALVTAIGAVIVARRR